MIIRKAEMADLSRIERIYARARAFMAETGNPDQWGIVYPPEELIKEDIRQGRLYAVTDNGKIHGVFVFFIGEDPSYRQIEGGSWISADEYGVIHRVAGDGEVHGILRQAIAFCEQSIGHLRIDTHRDNQIMRHTILKNGFVQCGIIHLADGSARIAYEKIITIQDTGK